VASGASRAGALEADSPRTANDPEDPSGLAKHAFLAQGDDRVGAVAELTRRLADAKVNVTAAAATAAGAGRYGMVLWVAQGDYEAAAKALGA
jgi:hypothetical protein